MSEEEQEQFWNVCAVARDKINNLAEYILNDPHSTSLKDIKRFWKYYNMYDINCLAPITDIVKGDEIERGGGYIR